MITTIIFDIGGVFVKGTSEEFLRNTSRILGVDIEKVKVERELWNDMQRGNMPLQEFIRKVFDNPISDEKMEELIEVWLNNWKLDFDMIEFGKKFKPKYRLIMLTNVDEETVNRYKDRSYHFDFFDHVFYSFKLGMIKPEKEIYEYALKELDVKPEECVFIDDKSENVRAAKELGIHGVVFENKEQLKQDLEKLGVMVG